MFRNLEGRNALVTGAARGIGFAIAAALAEHGADVTVTDIDVEGGKLAESNLVQAGHTASFRKLDVSKQADVTALADEFRSQNKNVDILVNNAGIVSTENLDEVDLEHWQRLLSVNLTSVFLLVKAFLPSMVARRWGRVINIASVAGQQGGGLFGNSCYAAAKGGVIAFTKGIAREAGRSGVTCNVLCPALTETTMTASMPDELRQRVIGAIPMGRGAKPEEIASVAAFLASEDASFVTGVTLDVDGGFMRA